MQHTDIMRSYINQVDISYKQQLVGSTMLSEGAVWDKVKATLGGMISSLKMPGKIVWQLLVGIAVFSWRNKVKTAVAGTLAATGVLAPLYNQIKDALHRGIQISDLMSKLQNLELKAKNVDMWITNFSVVTPEQMSQYLDGAKKIIQQGLVTPQGGWLMAGLKNIAGSNRPEEQLANAIAHVGIELGLPVTLTFTFFIWLYRQIQNNKKELDLQAIRKFMEDYPKTEAMLREKIVNELVQSLQQGNISLPNPDAENKPKQITQDPVKQLPGPTNEMRYFINQVSV